MNEDDAMPMRSRIALALAALPLAAAASPPMAPGPIAPPGTSLALPAPGHDAPGSAGTRVSPRHQLSVVHRMNPLIGGGDDFAVNANRPPEDPRDKFDRRADALTRPDQVPSGN